MEMRRAIAGDEGVLYDIRRRAILALSAPVLSPEQAEQWIAQATPARFTNAIREHDVWLAVAEGVIGWVEIDRERIAALYVMPAHAQRGVGSSLLAHAETMIRSSGYTRAYLAASQNALHFYLGRGYVQVGDPDEMGAYPLHKDLGVFGPM